MARFRYGKYFVLAICLIGISSKLTNAESGPDWAAQMRALLEAYGNLATFTYNNSANREQSSSERKALVADVKRFTEIAKAVHKKAEAKEASDDPSLPFIAKRLEDNAAGALRAIESNNLDFARFRLRKLATNCFQCHSRNAEGPEFNAFNTRVEGLKLKPTELSEVYVATRQFRRAMEMLEQNITSSELLKKSPLDLEKAIRQYLAIAIRVKADKAAALSLADKVLKMDEIPGYLKERVTRWRKDLADWQTSETKAKENTLKTAGALISEARRVQKYPLDNSGDVLYLRATALLHSYLQGKRSAKEKAEALYDLGFAYDVLNDMGQWYLQDVYYEACIREFPGSEAAKRCFHRFENSLFIGYSGSGGVSVPEEERKKLNDLRALAFKK